jgi:hypothetical protein
MNCPNCQSAIEADQKLYRTCELNCQVDCSGCGSPVHIGHQYRSGSLIRFSKIAGIFYLRFGNFSIFSLAFVPPIQKSPGTEPRKVLLLLILGLKDDIIFLIEHGLVVKDGPN